MKNNEIEVLGIVPLPGNENFTIYERLLMELNGRMYYDKNTYTKFLAENNLDGELAYDKESHYIAILETVYAILHTLANNIDLYRKIETEFVTQGEAASSLNKRLQSLKSEIKNLKIEKESQDSDFSFMYFTRQMGDGRYDN